jgi:hypothetical protein
LLLLHFSPILLSLHYSVSLHYHRMLSSVSFGLQDGQSRSGFLSFCYGVWLYCKQFSIWLPPPDRAFTAYQCHFANLCSFFLFHSINFPPFCRLLAIYVLIHPLSPLVETFRRSGSTPLRFRLFQHVLAPNTVLNFLFVYS